MQQTQLDRHGSILQLYVNKGFSNFVQQTVSVI